MLWPLLLLHLAAAAVALVLVRRGKVGTTVFTEKP